MQLSKKQIDLYKRDIISRAEDLYFLGPNRPIHLSDYQKQILGECTKKNSDNTFQYEIAVLSMPRRKGNSELSIILGFWSLFFGEGERDL
jgi:hypothetical protein